MGMKRPAAIGEIEQVQGGHIVPPTGRKDRHSKVFTAKGPRDRRLRLSAHTAIQFYDVQDRLGYDRPSKAVDWLISKAQSAIDKLDHLPPFHPTAAGAGSGEMALPDDSESSEYDFQKSFFPTSSSASCIKFQSYPPEFIPPSTGKDLCLSLQSLQDSTNQAPSTDQTTLFTGDPNFQRMMAWGSESGENRGGAARFMFGSLQQSLMLSSQRELNQSNFAEPSSMMNSSDHRSRFGLPEFFPPPQIHGQDEHRVGSGEPSSATPTSSHN